MARYKIKVKYRPTVGEWMGEMYRIRFFFFSEYLDLVWGLTAPDVTDKVHRWIRTYEAVQAKETAYQPFKFYLDSKDLP